MQGVVSYEGCVPGWSRLSITLEFEVCTGIKKTPSDAWKGREGIPVPKNASFQLYSFLVGAQKYCRAVGGGRFSFFRSWGGGSTMAWKGIDKPVFEHAPKPLPRVGPLEHHYIYRYICIYIYMCVCVCFGIKRHSFMHICIYIYMYTYIYICMYIYIYVLAPVHGLAKQGTHC